MKTEIRRNASTMCTITTTLENSENKGTENMDDNKEFEDKLKPVLALQ